MATNYRIAQAEDLENIYEFALQNLKSELKKSSSSETELDDMTLMMKVWESNFRKEALEHYLKLGWSFIAYDEGEKHQPLLGFFLGQPLLFFEGQTQSLWVELLIATDYKIEAELTEIAIKLSKDKHFQRAILPKSVATLKFEKPFNFSTWSDRSVFVKTTK